MGRRQRYKPAREIQLAHPPPLLRGLRRLLLGLPLIPTHARCEGVEEAQHPAAEPSRAGVVVVVTVVVIIHLNVGAKIITPCSRAGRTAF
eukprot:2974167-Rhodomonas_salina.1